MQTERKIVNAGLFLGTIFLAYQCLIILFTGGLFGSVQAMMFLFLPIVFILNAKREIWLGLLFGILAFSGHRVEIPFFDALNFYGMLVLVFFGFFILDLSMRQISPLFHRKRVYYNLLLLFGLFVIMRFASDPPASARLSATGGLSIALGFIFVAICFPLVYWICGMVTDWKKSLAMAVLFNIVAYALIVVVPSFSVGGVAYGLFRIFSGAFNRPSYLLMGIALSWAAARSFGNNSGKAFLLMSTFILLLGAISGARSTPVQAVAIVWCAAFVYTKFAKVAAITLAAFVLGVGLLLAAIPFEQIPGPVQRSISGFMPDTSTVSSQLGELGWESGFRERLYRDAWKEIKTNPVFGAGWTFNRQEILSAISVADFREARWSHLGMTGSYHNTFLTIAAKNGLIAAAVFSVAIIGLMVSLGLWLRRHPKGKIKILGTSFLCFSVNNFLLMFVNGTSYEAFCVLSGLAVISYLRDAEERGKVSDQELWR